MNHNQLIELCKVLKLGKPLNEHQRVYGGLLHIMWRVDTTDGSYAVKQLSSHIDVTNEEIVKNYNLTEEIAARFVEHGIPAVSAIKQTDAYLTMVNGVGFLVYPWVDAVPLDNDTVSELHALKVAEILATMHNTNLNVAEIAQPLLDVHPNDNLIQLIRKSCNYDCPFATILTSQKNDILAINTAYHKTIPLLKQQSVVSHGDLDQKNVLWNKNNNPFLIDWESARKLNPTYEIVNASLDWSGITTNFNKTVFIKMLQAYTAAGGMLEKNLLQAAFNGVLGNWINWMVYNIERACTAPEPEQKNMGVEQVNQVLNTIGKLKNIIPELMA